MVQRTSGELLQDGLDLTGGRHARIRARAVGPRFDTEPAEVLRRGVPVRRIADRTVTTVYDLLLAQYGVGRDGLPGQWPAGYGDASQPYTTAWQEPITGVPSRTFACLCPDCAGVWSASIARYVVSEWNHWFVPAPMRIIERPPKPPPDCAIVADHPGPAVPHGC